MNIAVVNLDKAIVQSTQGKALQQRIHTFQREAQTSIQALTQKLQELRRLLADGAATLSSEQLELLRQNFENGKQQLQRFQEDKQQEGEQMKMKELKRIRQMLLPLLQNLRNENAYDVILDSKVVLVVADKIDITEVVAMRLSQEN